MLYEVSKYRGDDVYHMCCTGDAVVGDEVCFDRAIFSGDFRNARFERYERVEGKITGDSYGAKKQQHTFTLLRNDGKKLLIKGRNLYANGVWRKPWLNEAARLEALDEKHERGNEARALREIRKWGIQSSSCSTVPVWWGG